jgi:hypothetical protein
LYASHKRVYAHLRGAIASLEGCTAEAWPLPETAAFALTNMIATKIGGGAHGHQRSQEGQRDGLQRRCVLSGHRAHAGSSGQVRTTNLSALMPLSTAPSAVAIAARERLASQAVERAAGSLRGSVDGFLRKIAI